MVVRKLKTGTLAERNRWRRERDARWDNARMSAYAEYGDAVKKVNHLASRIAAGRGLPHSVEPRTPDAAAMEALEEAGGVRARAWERVLLLGDPQTVAAARAWHEATWVLVYYAQGRVPSPDQWEPAMRETEVTRDRFYACARKDLGVKGEAVSTPIWPPESLRKLSVPAEQVPASEDLRIAGALFSLVLPHQPGARTLRVLRPGLA